MLDLGLMTWVVAPHAPSTHMPIHPPTNQPPNQLNKSPARFAPPRPARPLAQRRSFDEYLPDIIVQTRFPQTVPMPARPSSGGNENESWRGTCLGLRTCVLLVPPPWVLRNCRPPTMRGSPRHQRHKTHQSDLSHLVVSSLTSMAVMA